MDRDRVRGYFGNHNSNLVEGGFGANLTTLTGGGADITGDSVILQPSTQKNNRKLAYIILAIVFVVAVVGAVAALVIGLRSGSNGASVDYDILELMESSYNEISSYQSTLVEGKSGRMRITGLFSESNRDNFNNFLSKMQEFSTQLDSFNQESISNSDARENFVVLRDAIRDDLPSYIKVVDLYNLLYDYVNNGLDSSYTAEIVQLSGDDSILDNFKSSATQLNGYNDSAIVYDIFNAALDRDYPKVYYYELIGKIIAELKDE